LVNIDTKNGDLKKKEEKILVKKVTSSTPLFAVVVVVFGLKIDSSLTGYCSAVQTG